MSTKEFANKKTKKKKWALKQRLLKTKSEVFSLQSQLYKALAFYEEEKHSLKLQLNSLYEDLNSTARIAMTQYQSQQRMRNLAKTRLMEL